MSLTGHLASPSSPIRRWFAARFPSAKAVQDAWRAAGPVTILPALERPPWALLGAAFDYRLRYNLAPTPTARLVAAKGAATLARSARRAGLEDWVGEPSSFAAVAVALDAFLADHNPAALDAGNEHTLARYCLVLAMYEAFYRRPSLDPARSPLALLGPHASVEDQLALAEDAAADDVAALARAFAAQPAVLEPPFVCNPTFAGSLFVGGADADVIANRVLVDVKTTTERSCDRQWVWQLLGYVLLDWDDRYAIDHVALYSSRVPALLRWPVADLLDALGCSSSLGDLRGELRDVVGTLPGLRVRLRVRPRAVAQGGAATGGDAT